MQKIMTCLWFDNQAEEAAQFYVSVFKNSRIVKVTHYGENMPMPAGTVMTVVFEVDGQRFMGLNGGPVFNFTEAISLVVHCETQEELDALWDKLLSGGGSESMCGWLKDKYGLSWQVVPSDLHELISDEDPARSQRVMQAVMQMVKLDIAKMQQAYDAPA